MLFSLLCVHDKVIYSSCRNSHTAVVACLDAGWHPGLGVQTGPRTNGCITGYPNRCISSRVNPTQPYYGRNWLPGCQVASRPWDQDRSRWGERGQAQGKNLGEPEQQDSLLIHTSPRAMFAAP